MVQVDLKVGAHKSEHLDAIGSKEAWSFLCFTLLPSILLLLLLHEVEGMDKEWSNCHDLAYAELEDLMELLCYLVLILYLQAFLLLQDLLMLRVVLQGEIHFNSDGPGANEWPCPTTRARLSNPLLRLAFAELEYCRVMIDYELNYSLQVVEKVLEELAHNIVLLLTSLLLMTT